MPRAAPAGEALFTNIVLVDPGGGMYRCFCRAGLRSGFMSACAALLASSVSLSSAQNVKDLSQADRDKLATLNAFLANLDAFLPTVNRMDLDSLPVTFPYREVQGHIIIDVGFGGGEPVPFMLDTGAPTTVAQPIADKHAGKTLVEMGGLAAGNVLFWSPLKSFPKVRLGKRVDVSDMTASIGWDAEAFFCISRNGLLGASTMRNAIWQIDYGKHTVSIARSVDQLRHVKGAIKVPFVTKARTLSPTPVVEIDVGSGKLTFVVDSGGGVPLTINSASLGKVGLKLPDNAPTALNLAAGAAGAFEANYRSMTIPVGIGGKSFNTTVLVGDGMAPSTDGNMGHEFLKNFVVTFDWSTNTMYLDPLNADGSINTISDAPSAAVGYQGGKIIVTSIPKGGPADKAGLKLGEVVTAIDGADVSRFSQAEFCQVVDADKSSITTESGKTYDASKIKGFFTSMRQ